MVTLLERLRSETRAAHEQLEGSVQIERRIADPNLYRDLLEKFLGFYEPLEAKLAALSGWEEFGIDLKVRTKIPWLVRDLQALGLTPAEIAALPRCSDLPQLDTLGRGFGCAYVLEGSTLGGRHISAMLSKREIPVDARTFFASYGDAVGERWKEFIAAMEKFAATRGGEGVVESARETFDGIQTWVAASKGR